jgi:hypothetical protein
MYRDFAAVVYLPEAQYTYIHRGGEGGRVETERRGEGNRG